MDWTWVLPLCSARLKMTLAGDRAFALDRRNKFRRVTMVVMTMLTNPASTGNF